MSSVQSYSQKESKNNTHSNFRSGNATKTTFAFSGHNTMKDYTHRIPTSPDNREAYEVEGNQNYWNNNVKSTIQPFNFKYSLIRQNNPSNKVVSNIREKFLIAQKKLSVKTISNKNVNDALQLWTNNTTKIEENVKEENRLNTNSTIGDYRGAKKSVNRKFTPIGPMMKKLKVPNGYSFNKGMNTIIKNDLDNHTINTTIHSPVKISKATFKNTIISTSPKTRFRDSISTVQTNQNSPRSKTHKETITAASMGVSNEEYQKMLKEKLFFKKMLKGRLLKTIAKSVVIDTDTIEQYKNDKEYHVEKGTIEHLKEYRREKNLGIITQKSPEILLPDSDAYTARYEDIYVTPDELIYKNFTKKEIDIIKSDPAFFKLNKSPFRNINILRNRTLLEQMEEEEKTKLKNLKLKSMRIMKLKSLAQIEFNVDADQKEKNNISEHKTKSSQPDTKRKLMIKIDEEKKEEKNKQESMNSSNIKSTPKREVKLHRVISSLQNNNINRDNYSLTHAEKSVTFPEIPYSYINDNIKDHEKNKKGFDEKMQLYQERRKMANYANIDKLRKNKDKNDAKKKIHQVKTQREMEDLFVTSQIVNKIKEIYKNKE